MPWTPEQRQRYGPNWRQISKNIRFKRAHGRCENCGAIHGQRNFFTNYVVKLACAHRDHDETNHSATNLMALCDACHLNHDRTDNLRRARLTRMRNKDAARPLLQLEKESGNAS